MPARRPTTIAEYIRAARPVAQPHLRRLHAILKSVAPKATETIKWGVPHYVNPRFVCAYSAHKAHISFAPSSAALEHFRKELAEYETTTNFLKLPYAEPLPEALIRKLAKYRLRNMGDGEGFW